MTAVMMMTIDDSEPPVNCSANFELLIAIIMFIVRVVLYGILSSLSLL